MHFHTSMSGKGKQGRGCGDHRARGGRVIRRGNIYSSHIYNLNNKNKGFYSALGHRVFNYGQKGAADQMRMTWEKIFKHVGTIYGRIIRYASQNKKRVNILQPIHNQEVKDKHMKIVEEFRDQN